MAEQIRQCARSTCQKKTTEWRPVKIYKQNGKFEYATYCMPCFRAFQQYLTPTPEEHLPGEANSSSALGISNVCGERMTYNKWNTASREHEWGTKGIKIKLD